MSYIFKFKKVEMLETRYALKQRIAQIKKDLINSRNSSDTYLKNTVQDLQMAKMLLRKLFDAEEIKQEYQNII